MAGKFVLSQDKIFDEIRQNEAFYVEFFERSFGYDLLVKPGYAYLVSNDSAEMLSRDICIFFAILCYEMDRDGKDFFDRMKYSEFNFEEVDQYFENTTYIDLVHSNKQVRDSETRRNLINTMARRNVIEKLSEDRFSFTQAADVFVDFARNFAKGKLQESF